MAALSLCLTAPAMAQAARISEETRTLQTYPFSEPDPVPILARDARLYPYHSFDGYAASPEPRPWKVVRLENDYIEVFVLPEAGGKVWGAVVKATGHEFIYRNEVMKFRNISLRGPWTSGGIEFNFGVIGHTPSTATPVDYLLRENDDGSVSCFVGGMDLPSRTHWRVEIRLPADKAYFETNVLWSNPTPLEQPYYNWMTAAAFARDDLEMVIPGDAYLRHSGAEREWPFDDEGRYLPLYGNNTFEGHKSYHVVGEINDFFGGYYHDDDYGFGHWARYEDMPGQKLWLWALSREGGVWEELLTDTDGQYVEFQAGRLFVQYAPGEQVNPITQAGFDPLSASRWSETWFPLEGIGGLTDASRDGAMHVSLDGGELTVGVNAFTTVFDTLEVWSADRLVAAIPVELMPLGRFQTTVEVAAGAPYRVRIAALDLDYESDPSARRLARPFSTDPAAVAAVPEVDRMVFEARELQKGRRYAQARVLFEAATDEEPWNRGARLGLAELGYRSGRYEDALRNVNRALQLDAYDAEANFLAGTLYRAVGRIADARDAFGWAARSTAYRSAANTQLAEIMIGEGDLTEAARYARLAIDYDRHSVPGWRALAVVGRLGSDDGAARDAVAELLAVDPLHHFAVAEAHLRAPTSATAQALNARMGGEYPGQTLLELAIGYANLGLRSDALELLALPMERPVGPVRQAWRAFLLDDASLLADPGDAAFQFPFRRESLPVLAWADEHSADWIWTYLRALNLWAMDRAEETATLFRDLGETPDFAPFYVARAQLLGRVGDTAGGRESIDSARLTADFSRAVALDPQTRVLQVYLVRHLQDEGRWDEALVALESARARFPDDFNTALLQARALINVGSAEDAVQILGSIHVLPSENARDSHRLWEHANTFAALDALDAGDDARAAEYLGAALEWPESLGQGRPYEPEERLVRYLLGRVEDRRGNPRGAREQYELVVAATGGLSRPPSRLDLLLVGALKALRPSDLEPLLDQDLGSSDSARAWRRLAESAVGQQPVSSSILRSIVADYPLLFDDLEGRLILRALATGGSDR
jgi:tetratricopeptide (TPR) repeat protein